MSRIAPRLDEIEPGCDGRDLNRLSHLLAQAGISSSISGIHSALIGHRTRRTKRYPGNADYFETAREAAVKLIRSRRAGTPWPELDMSPAYKAGGCAKNELEEAKAMIRSLEQSNAKLADDARALRGELEALKIQKADIEALLREDLLAANDEAHRLRQLLSIIRKTTRLA